MCLLMDGGDGYIIRHLWCLVNGVIYDLSFLAICVVCVLESLCSIRHTSCFFQIFTTLNSLGCKTCRGSISSNHRILSSSSPRPTSPLDPVSCPPLPLSLIETLLTHFLPIPTSVHINHRRYSNTIISNVGIVIATLYSMQYPLSTCTSTLKQNAYIE